MLGFLFNKKESAKGFLASEINEIYSKLKEFYKVEEISNERKSQLRALVERFQYLPYPHIKALEGLTDAEVLFCLETKWKINKIFDGEFFSYENPSPLLRNNVKNADWIKKEGHDIKLINLAGLGNGNKSKDAGKFIDWMRQLLILPMGVEHRGIFATTIYLIPFHPREFGCAYLPTDSGVSSELEDKNLKNLLGVEFNFDAKKQVQAFITFAQLAGHPVICDILPQTGRFSKIVLANPYVARWFDTKELLFMIECSLDSAAQKLEKKFDKEDVEIVKDIYKQALKSATGVSGDLSADYQKIFDELENELLGLKKSYSNEMMKKENQIKLQKRVSQIVAKRQGGTNNNPVILSQVKNLAEMLRLKPQHDVILSEEDITKQSDIVKELMNEGLWTAPGGAWCSSGTPVFDRMSDCASYPLFRHFDFKGEDVTEFANLDCQTPFYFTYLENGESNKQVIDFFVDYVSTLREEYNFDGARFDHMDHIVDEVSEKNGKAISYRAPKEALAKLNSSIKLKVPYFATIAEYMLGGNYLMEYHQDMKFDVLWGDDLSSQDYKAPEKIVEDNQNLACYNTNLKMGHLSILKTYNNQDGEFSVINQYPGQLGEDGALFKWFKYKFLPGGKYAQRPVLYVDGDESFTKTGIEKAIGNEISMKREKNYDFFAKFDAINRFSKSQELVTEGEAQIIEQDEEGFVSWMISKEPLKTSLLVVANYNIKDSLEEIDADEIEDLNVFDKSVNLPSDYRFASEFIFDGENFVEQKLEEETSSLSFEKIEPSEFKIYLLNK